MKAAVCLSVGVCSRAALDVCSRSASGHDSGTSLSTDSPANNIDSMASFGQLNQPQPDPSESANESPSNQTYGSGFGLVKRVSTLLTPGMSECASLKCNQRCCCIKFNKPDPISMHSNQFHSRFLVQNNDNVSETRSKPNNGFSPIRGVQGFHFRVRVAYECDGSRSQRRHMQVKPISISVDLFWNFVRCGELVCLCAGGGFNAICVCNRRVKPFT